MADTERAFAKRAADTTVRQAFIDFFADESIAFEPDPVPARESLRKREGRHSRRAFSCCGSRASATSRRAAISAISPGPRNT